MKLKQALLLESDFSKYEAYETTLKKKHPAEYENIWRLWINPESEISMDLNYYLRSDKRDKHLATREATRAKVGPKKDFPDAWANEDPKKFKAWEKNLEFYLNEDYEKLIENMDTILKHHSVTLPNKIFYRGIKGKPSNFTPGKTFTEKGYSSITSDKKTAEVYATESATIGKPIIFYIKLSKKSKGTLGKKYDQEYILPRNSVYRIDKIEPGDDITNIYVTHLESK